MVNTININNAEVKEKCYHMFQIWLERTVNSCWCHFVAALKKVKLLEIASEVEQKFSYSGKYNISDNKEMMCKILANASWKEK